jgi:hypothetical protein
MSRHVSFRDLIGGDRDRADSVWLESGEETPLRSGAVIVHHDSVYSLMVFAPPLSRLDVGHYWSLRVLMSCSLFIIALVCQLGLTLIAGAYIQDRSASFKKDLLKISDNADATGSVTITPAHRVITEVKEYVKDSVARDYYFFEKWLREYVAKDDVKNKCCDGAECSALQIHCCDRSDVKVGSARMERNTSMLLVMNPLKETEPRYRGRTWNEMCRQQGDGMISCMPPSYLFIDAWDDLDSNGDGTWTLEEARTDQANLGCRFGISADEIFRSVCSGIQKDASDTADNSYTIPLVPTEIELYQSIPKGYFDWWTSMVVICSSTDVHRCSSLIGAGIFDGALHISRDYGFSRGGIADLDTALDFCQRMLTKDGICEKALPSSYLLHRSHSAASCGTASFSVDKRYFNPYNERDAMIIQGVEYAQYAEYQTSATFEFQFFLALILLVWYMSLLFELKQIFALADFTINFRVNSHSPTLTPRMQDWIRNHCTGKLEIIAKLWLPRREYEEDAPSDEVSSCHAQSVHWKPASGTFGSHWHSLENILVIGSHSLAHRNLCFIMVAVRLFLLCYMADVGTSFMIYQRDYSELLMNAVALTFIFKLPELLYVLLVPDFMQERLHGATCTPFRTSLPRSGFCKFMHSSMVWGLIFMPLFTTTVVFYNLQCNTKPFLEALECACYQQGSSCLEAQRFEKAWWDDFWQSSIPLGKTRASWLQQ